MISSEMPPEFENIFNTLKKRLQAITGSRVFKDSFHDPGGVEEVGGKASDITVDYAAGEQLSNEPRGGAVLMTLEDYLGTHVTHKTTVTDKSKGHRSSEPPSFASGKNKAAGGSGRRR